MEMVERYIYAVTKKLPEKQRSDIEQELRSLIEDMLSAQAKMAHQQPRMLRRCCLN